MAVPKKVKYSIDTNPPRPGNDYLEYGMDRIEELMQKTDEKTKYLPRTILLEDLDQAVFDFANSEKMKIVLEGRKVPVFYLDNDRWGEFSKTWKFMDNDKNVPTPYITVRRISKEPGTRLGTKYRVPQPRKFRYVDVPILDEGEIIYLRFKMPQPVNVDLTHEVSLFTKYRVDVNIFDEHVLKNFASRQDYVFIKGTPFPLLLDNISEPKNIENIDGDKLFISKYTIKILGFLQNEEEFEIVKTLRKIKINQIIYT